MKNIIVLFILFSVVGCGGQTKEELTLEGGQFLGDGNYRGAVVLYKNALEKDPNFIEARLGLAKAYMGSGDLDRAEKEYQKVILQDASKSELLLDLAEIHLLQNLPEKALIDLDSFHSEHSDSVVSLVLYGRVHGSLGDLLSAKKLFLEALSLNSNAISPRINLARVYLQQREYSKAKEYLQQSIQIDSRESSAYYLLANIFMREKDTESALKVYENLLQVDNMQIQALYLSGVLQMDLGLLDDAKVSVDKMLVDFAGRPEGQRLKGMLLYRQSSYDEAKIVLESSIQAQPHLLSYFFLGLSYYGLNQYELALNQFQKALDFNPDFERARILVALTLLKQKRLDDSIIEIQKVLRANPENAYAHNILGSALLVDGQYDKGMKELELATELDPSLVDAHMKRGVLHLSQGENVSGEEDLIRAVNAAPEVLNSRLMLVTHYLRQKNFSDAIQLLREGMNGSESDALLGNYLAAAYFSQKNPDLALKSLDEAKKKDPNYLTPYFNIASYYSSQSQYDLAIAEYQEILSRAPVNLRALLGLASLYNVMGDQLSVKSTFDKIEGIGTEDGFVAAVQYKLKVNDKEEAFAIVERGLQEYKSSSDLLELSGILSINEKQFDVAETVFTQLSGISPEKGYTHLINLHLMAGQPDKAQQVVDGLFSSFGDKEFTYVLSSRLLFSQQKVADAVSTLQQGIATIKDSFRLQMQLGHLYNQQNDFAGAERQYLEIIKKSPRFSPAYTSLGFLKESTGEKGEALELYKKALQYDKRNISALNNIAYLLADNFGEQSSALNYAMSAYRLKPSDPRIMDTLGYVLVKNNRAKEALILLEASYQSLPQNLAVALHLAQAKVQVGDKDEALILLNKIKSEGSDFEIKQAEQLIRKL